MNKTSIFHIFLTFRPHITYLILYMSAFSCNDTLYACWHGQNQVSAHSFDFFVVKPNFYYCLNQLGFGSTVMPTKSLLNQCPEILYWIQIGGVSRPWQCLYIIVSHKFGNFFRRMARCEILLEHSVPVRKLVRQLRNKLSLQNLDVRNSIHHSCNWFQRTRPLNAKASPKHFLTYLLLLIYFYLYTMRSQISL